MKNEKYIAPEMEVVDVKMNSVLMVSGDDQTKVCNIRVQPDYIG